MLKALATLGAKASKNDVELMIWEVDDDIDGFVSEKEFEKMYKRCTRMVESGLEPRKLFNLVVFLMYDKECRGKVTVEDTLQILYVRYGRNKLDEEIRAIFGDMEKTLEGNEKAITYPEYLKKIRKRAMEERRERKMLMKANYH